MSIEIEDNCVGPCPQGCRIYCPMKRVAVHHCESCGDVLHEGDNHWHEDGKNEYCDDCYYDAIKFEESITVDNARANGAAHTGEVTINGFLAFIYDPDEIEEILWRDFSAMPEYNQRSNIAEWATVDEEEWIEFFGLEENL